MEFRLVFRGSLPSHGRRGDKAAKHGIRKELHPQLKTFWKQHPLLKGHLEPGAGEPSVVEQVANDFARCGFRFVPVVDTSGACALDILLLLREEPFRLLNAAGDIDGRVKTLLDGLRMPQQCTEIPDGQRPSADENPFFVLLQDDSVVYELNVTTDRLFTPPEPQGGLRDVVAVIRVRIKPVSGNPVSIYGYGP